MRVFFARMCVCVCARLCGPQKSPQVIARRETRYHPHRGQQGHIEDGHRVPHFVLYTYQSFSE